MEVMEIFSKSGRMRDCCERAGTSTLLELHYLWVIRRTGFGIVGTGSVLAVKVLVVCYVGKAPPATLQPQLLPLGGPLRLLAEHVQKTRLGQLIGHFWLEVDVRIDGVIVLFQRGEEGGVDLVRRGEDNLRAAGREAQAGEAEGEEKSDASLGGSGHGCLVRFVLCCIE